MSYSKKKPLVVISHITTLGSLVLFFILLFIESFSSSINVPTGHLDGAFQTASGLFRIKSGELPGRDFYPYLGIGPLLAIYPVFNIFGGDLAASLLSAKFVVLVSSWISITVLWQLTLKPSQLTTSLVGGACFLSILLFMENEIPFANIFSFALEPGNSLRPLRSFIPYAVAITIYTLLVFPSKRIAQSAYFGILMGIALLWSNDYALSTVGIFSLFLFFYILKAKNFIMPLCSFALSAIITWAILITLITQNHVYDLLVYNFLSVPVDQWWLFGPYDSSSRIFGLTDIPKIFSAENFYPCLILVLSLIVSLQTKKIEHTMIFLIGVALFSGGSVASIGGHIGGYFGSFYFWSVALTILVLLKAISTIISLVHTSQVYSHPVLNACACIAFFYYVFYAFDTLSNERKSTKADPGKIYVQELGGYIGAEWQPYIDFVRANKDKVILEEYWGLWSAMNKNASLWPVDSVIHALGKVRENARSKIPTANLIISTRYWTSPVWQPWNLSQNFWFYEQLLSNWELTFFSPTTVVWKKLEKPRHEYTVGCDILEDKKSFELPSAQANEFYKVTLNYQVSQKKRHLLMVRNNISFGADADGYVSIPTNQSNITIPVFVSNENLSRFDLKNIGNHAIESKLISCSAKKISLRHQDILHVMAFEVYLTDENWFNGIARGHAGFFLPKEPQFLEEYKVGKFVKFRNGEIRKIVSIEYSDKYINVNVKGGLLEFNTAGVPSEFEVLDRAFEFYLTDENWINGIARAHAGFFVPNEPPFSDDYKVGRLVKFKNGDARKIMSIEYSKNYINVNVDGEILEPNATGIPNEFKIFEE